jgi:glycosyltransferase involved in cell wall biosynthesis
MSRENKMIKEFFVISLLDGKGPTGVEMHFNQLIREARAYGIEGTIVSPFPSGRLWTKFARVLIRAIGLLDKERAGMLARRVDSRVLEGKLKQALLRRANRSDPVTLYAQDPLSARVALKLRKAIPCRVVSVVHYNISEAYELSMKGEAAEGGPLWRSVMATERETLSQVNQIIFVSDVMRKLILERLPELAHVPHTVIPNFVARPAVPGNPSVIADMISIGTLEPRKNQEFLLRVLARSNELGHRHTLTVVGDGPDRAKLMALAKELHLEEQVRFAGFQRNAAALISQHRIFVHAAHFESFGIVLVEALSLGRPILAPAVGGITEVFRDAIEGYYWRLDDIDGAAALLIKLLSDPETYRDFSQAALNRYRENFDSTLLVNRWLAAIFSQQIAHRASYDSSSHAARLLHRTQ